MDKKTCLAIMVPCYNEELVIGSTVKTLIEYIDSLASSGKISKDSFLFLVDDGSKDNTWNIIEQLRETYGSRLKGLKFVRNYGNQKALIAGLTALNGINCDCAVSIDADLQQDVNAIEKFIDEFHNGAEIVSGIRNDRKTDGPIKKYTALCFYKLMNMLGVKIPANHSDFRLVSKKALEILSKYNERELFLRGFFHETGLKTSYIYFDVKPRMLGSSKFNLFSLTSLALNGITSYSIVPLRFISAIGVITIIISTLLGLDAILEKIFLQNTPSGWATMVTMLAFFGGLQLFCLGIIGEYLGQVYNEVKARPRYIVDKELY